MDKINLDAFTDRNPNFFYVNGIVEHIYLSDSILDDIDVNEVVSYLIKHMDIIKWKYFLEKSTNQVVLFIEQMLEIMGIDNFHEKLSKNKSFHDFLHYLNPNILIFNQSNNIDDKIDVSYHDTLLVDNEAIFYKILF